MAERLRELDERLRPRNDLLCVEWDVKAYTLTHSLDERFRMGGQFEAIIDWRVTFRTIAT